MWWEVGVSSFIWLFNYPSTIYQENSLPLFCNVILVINQVFIHMWTCFWALYFLSLVYLPFLTPISQCLKYHCFIKSWYLVAQFFMFVLLQDCLGYFSALCFHILEPAYQVIHTQAHTYRVCTFIGIVHWICRFVCGERISLKYWVF